MWTVYQRKMELQQQTCGNIVDLVKVRYPHTGYIWVGDQPLEQVELYREVGIKFDPLPIIDSINIDIEGYVNIQRRRWIRWVCKERKQYANYFNNMLEEFLEGEDIFDLRKLFGMEEWEQEEEWMEWLEQNWDDDIDAILETMGEDLQSGLRIEEEEDDDIKIVFERKRLRRDDDDDEDVGEFSFYFYFIIAEEDDEEESEESDKESDEEESDEKESDEKEQDSEETKKETKEETEEESEED
ncbi:hypothetical protein DMN91_003311 [Ooceraea biroi]|uniref:Uncharacterized protein n=1 Tax=Ooceraea biroi TaxID=2015173 RepID=A0A3L8DZI5_OOCBI|nr:hypothetical protein DMN91_003311 [Ooceraea biroi]